MISRRGIYEQARAQLKGHPGAVRLARRVIRPGGTPGLGEPPARHRRWIATSWFWLGTVANRGHRYDAAASSFARATRLDPRFGGWWARLGHTERLRGRLAEAIAAYERALALDVDSQKAHFWLAVCLNQPDGATSLPSTGARQRRERLSVEAAFVRVNDRIDALEPSFVFWLAVAERFRGNLARAEELCTIAVAGDAQPFWFQQLAEIRRLRSDWQGSVAAYERALILTAAATAIADDDTPASQDATPVPDPVEAEAGDVADHPDTPIVERIDDTGEALTLVGADKPDAEVDTEVPDAPPLAAEELALGDQPLPEELDDADLFAGSGGSRQAAEFTRATLPLRVQLHDTDSGRRTYRIRQQASAVENWPAVVALYGSVAADQGLDLHRRYWLGVALAGVGDVQAAIEAVEHVLANVAAGSPLESDLATILDKLVVWSTRAEHWESAAAHSDQLLTLEPSGAACFRAAIAYQRAGRWRESSDAFERGVALDGLSVSWLNRLGATRRSMEDWAGTAALYRRALGWQDDARFHFWVGFALSKLDEWPAAVAEYEAAIFRSRGRPDWHFRLGLAHERTGSPMTAVHPRLGLVRTQECNLPAAASAYRRSIELEPADARVWMRLGDTQERLGHLTEARDAFAEAVRLRPNDPQALHRYGRAIAAIGSQRGVFSHNEYDQLERTWGKVLELGPRHSGARQQLIRSSTRAARWPVASRTAWFPEPPVVPAWADALRSPIELEPTPERLDALADVLARPDDDLMVVPLEWWFVAHWRLLEAGRFTSAFRAKELMAKRVIADGAADPITEPSRFLEVARALNFLEQHDAALDHLAIGSHVEVPLATRWAAEKLAADIRLVLGDVEPYRAFLGLNERAVDRTTEVAFRKLIEGKRIAVVGPAQSETDQRDEIDGYDVVIRTKYVHSTFGDDTTAGTRTDISYYALGNARFLSHEIHDALAAGHLQMAVFRTATYDPEVRFLHHPGDLRYPPSEYQGGFRSGQFAIQRIFYDVLRYNPASVKVFNINFFLAANPYRDGYLAEYTKTYAERGLLQALNAFGHDYRSDFVFTQRLHTAGLVEADPAVRALLDLSAGQYLAGLDAKGLG